MGDKTSSLENCIIYVVYFIVFFIAGGLALNYLLTVVRDVTMPFFWAGIIGVAIGPFLVTAAIIVWILKMLGVI